MRLHPLHPWPTTPAEAIALQNRLRPMVDVAGPGPSPEHVRLAAGLDVAYATEGDRLAAGVTVVDTTTLEVVDTATTVGTAAFDYVPGLFAFRELPSLVTALERLRVDPDILVCDGQGIAHPRRFGLACHLGVLTGLPTIGVAKTPFVGRYDPPGDDRGDWSDLRDGDETVGRALRTRTEVKPVFVSVGHRIGLDTACRNVLALCAGYRLPETTRSADNAARSALRDSVRGAGRPR